MNVFLRKVVLLGSAFSLCLLFLNHLVFTSKKRYAGNPVYALKHDFFIQNQDEFNAVALGSSLTYRHLVPKRLDALLDTCKTSTFNLGGDAVFNPETYYLYENLLDEIADNSLDYAFIELVPLPNIETQNLATPRNYYWHNFRYWLFSTEYILDSNESLSTELENFHEYSLSYLYRLILGFRVLFLDLQNEDQDVKQDTERDGFYAFDAQMNSPETSLKTRDRLQGKYASFLKDVGVLENRISAAKETFSVAQDGDVNQAHLRKLQYLLDKSQAKGVDLIFFIPPRLETYEGLASIVESLPSDHVIEVFDPVKYPEIYRPDLSFDEIHLNEKGAEIFTRYFADAVSDVCVSSD